MTPGNESAALGGVRGGAGEALQLGPQHLSERAKLRQVGGEA